MYSPEVIEAVNTITTIKMSVTKDPRQVGLRNKLYEETSFLPKEYKLATRYYCVLNNVKEIPKCICGSDCVPNKLDAKLGFTEYCSPKCSREFSKLDKNIRAKLENKDWLYEQRIILRKSKELIAGELGCSITPINRWLEIHKIPEVKYNQSGNEQLEFLSNREWLYNQHVVLKKTCQEIADEIGSSRATISVWLEKHNIDANDSNIYPRKHVSISSPHQELVDYIKSIYGGNVIVNDRTVLNGLELDIYIPDKKLAIEYGSIYSHLYRPNETTFSTRKDATYHVTKTEKCEQQGIHLLQIFGANWKKDIWKSIIQIKLGVCNTKIYARKCQIKEISVYDKDRFLDENHLQGKDKSKYKFGLYYNDELVSVMTFGKSRYNQNYEWELIRFCVKQNTVIVGGFSRLLAHFRSQFSGSIISYADRTYSNGSVYVNNGFTLLKINPPGYWYVKKNTEIMLHRSNFRKDKITTPNDLRTEEEIMFSNGYSKIFDCGTKTYVMI